MNNLDKQYTDLLQDILDNGVTKSDRTGTGTISVFGRQIRHKMSDGFPLLTTKKMAWKSVVTELLWFLRGDTNIKFLVDNDCNIWTGDAYKKYSLIAGMSTQVQTLTKEEFINKIKTDDEFAKKWGELGPIYGKQWRSWNEIYSDWEKFDGGGVDDGLELKLFAHKGLMTRKKIKGIDQIANLINDLKTNPDSRRLMVNAWNVGELDSMVLPPCHYGFQVYTRELSRKEKIEYLFTYCYETGMERQIVESSWTDENFHAGYFNVPKRAISLMWNQRSVDTFLGLPFNIASYGLLLEIIAKEVNMVPDELIGNLGDVHLYSNHIEQAKEQIGRELTNDEWIDLMVKKHGMILEGGDDKLPTKTREPYPLPKLNIKLHFNNKPSFVPEHWLINDFEIEGYQSHPTIKAPLSN